MLCGAVAAPIQNGGQFAQKSFLQPDEKASEEGGFSIATCVKRREFTYVNKMEKMLDELPLVRKKLNLFGVIPSPSVKRVGNEQKQNLKCHLRSRHNSWIMLQLRQSCENLVTVVQDSSSTYCALKI